MFPNDELYAYAQRDGILFEAYSVLGSRDSAGHEGVHPAGGPELLEQEALIKVAEKYTKSPAQVCIRWALQRHPHAVLLVKSCTPEHLKQDLDVTDFKLDDEDMKALDSLPRRRFVSGEIFLSPEGPYRTLQELWDE